MATETATMQLPMDLIKPAIEAKVNAAVIEALGKTDHLIMRVVEQIMNQKVDNEGKHQSYDGYNKVSWLTWAVEDATKTAIKAAIQAHIATNTDKIKAAIDAEMRKSKSPLVQTLISSMAEGMAKAIEGNYRVNVEFSHR
jgi:CO dehydrogenase/acetyl-CoA synthase beta subunit